MIRIKHDPLFLTFLMNCDSSRIHPHKWSNVIHLRIQATNFHNKHNGQDKAQSAVFNDLWFYPYYPLTEQRTSNKNDHWDKAWSIIKRFAVPFDLPLSTQKSNDLEKIFITIGLKHNRHLKRFRFRQHYFLSIATFQEMDHQWKANGLLSKHLVQTLPSNNRNFGI